MTDKDVPPRDDNPYRMPNSPGKMVRRKLRGFEQVWFTRHSLDQMKVRQITAEDVFRAIANPSKTGLPTQPGRKRVRWTKARFTAIDDVYEEWDDMIVIVTAIKITS